jgi:hypothetical protein
MSHLTHLLDFFIIVTLWVQDEDATQVNFSVKTVDTGTKNFKLKNLCKNVASIKGTRDVSKAEKKTFNIKNQRKKVNGYYKIRFHIFFSSFFYE